MRRRAWILGAVRVVLAGGGLLAAFLSTESRERDAITDLVGDLARGDAAAVRERVDVCDRDCAFVARLSSGLGALRFGTYMGGTHA